MNFTLFITISRIVFIIITSLIIQRWFLDSTSLCKWMMLENNLSNQKGRKIMFKAINSSDRLPYYGLALQYMIIDDILFCEQDHGLGKR